ncbi:ATP-binding protein [Belliella sp. DSM 107340]|uniref:histidine kinase n=1 Tax=Belliella calami TaxID=2923436 RepID=A0ABS9US62_9BACT|nr:hybrid sensor histidine kinase/response regulator [Belliella calami]MCH7399462.1 ATP-binding protein [Belliella calami]
MKQKLLTTLLLNFLIFFFNHQLILAQTEIQDDSFLLPISTFESSQITNVGSSIFSIEEIIERSPNLEYQKIEGDNTNLGFTKDNYWLRFSVKNNSSDKLNLFFETGRPITDIVEFHQILKDGSISTQLSGDLIPFSDRPIEHRKIIFPLELDPNSTSEFYIQYQSDGEVINLPLNLHSTNSLMIESYLEQFVFGVFYGILLLAGSVYMFFYFGINEKSFILYTLYVLSIGFLHFSLDGYFVQYISSNANWLSRNSILFAAAFSTLAFGRYSQVYLDVKSFNLNLHKAFNILHTIVFVFISAVIILGDYKHLYYPLVNFLGIILLVLIVTSVINSYIKKSGPDIFFSLGILSFFLGFIFFILNNFSLIPNSFITENSSKIGTGFEVIFLSLSMANRIRKLKSEKVRMQTIALQRSQESNEIKSFFLSNISHELRTPLNAVIGLSKSIQSYTNDDKINKDLEIIQFSSLELLTSIDSILDYSKIEKKELKLEKKQIDLPKIIKEIRTTAENQAKVKNLNFRYEEINQLPKYILGDKDRFKQILINVLNNAIKFTNTGEVKLTIKSETSKDNTLKLSINITDTGVGIVKEKLDRVFESFIQAQIDDKRKFGGFGLGLCIVKALIELHKGEINITSVPEKGTNVNLQMDFDVPQNTFESSFHLKEEDGEYDLLGKNILIVEDNPVNQLVMKSVLRKWKNTTFDIANHGIEAIQKLKNQKFDLILMDLQMPEMDGYEATIAIRTGASGFENKNIPIVAVTADATEKAKLKVKEVGMDEYTTKPIDMDELYLKVKKCFYLQNVDISNIV